MAAPSTDNNNDEHVNQKPTDNNWGAISNLANTAIGAGILSFPFAYSLTGLGFGILLTLSFGIICSISQSWVATFQRRTKAQSYEELIGIIFQSKVAGTLMQIIVFVYQLGACVAYILVFIDQATPLIQYVVSEEKKAHGKNSGFMNFVSYRGIQVLFVSAFLMLPPSLFKNVKALEKISPIAICAVGIMTIVVISSGVQNINDTDGGIIKIVEEQVNVWETNFFNIARAIPILCFALQSHINVPIIMSSKPHAKPWGIILRAYGVVCSLYIPVGIFGYILFRKTVHTKDGFPGDVLNGFNIKDTFADVARGCMMITAVVSYPINHFPGRSATFNLLFPNRNNNSLPLMYFKIHAILFTALAALIAYAIPKIEVVFGIMGATVASSVMFIIPGLLVLRDKYMQDNGLKIDHDGVINYSQLEGFEDDDKHYHRSNTKKDRNSNMNYGSMLQSSDTLSSNNGYDDDEFASAFSTPSKNKSNSKKQNLINTRDRDLSFEVGNYHYSGTTKGWYMYTWLAVVYIFGGVFIAIVGTVMSLQGE
jgi:amino acid permease